MTTPKRKIIAKMETETIDLQTAVELFVMSCRSRSLSPRTVEYYSDGLLALTRFIDRYCPGTSPGDITPQLIREFLIDQATGHSPSTVCHRHTTLSVFFKYLIADGFLSSSPLETVDKPKRRHPLIRTLTPEQLQALLSTCGSDFYGIRDRTIIIWDWKSLMHSGGGLQ